MPGLGASLLNEIMDPYACIGAAFSEITNAAFEEWAMRSITARPTITTYRLYTPTRSFPGTLVRGLGWGGSQN